MRAAALTPSTPKNYCCMPTKQALITVLVMAIFAAGAFLCHYYRIGGIIAPSVLAGASFLTLVISIAATRLGEKKNLTQEIVKLYEAHTDFEDFEKVLPQKLGELSQDTLKGMFWHLLTTGPSTKAEDFFIPLEKHLDKTSLNSKNSRNESPLQVALAQFRTNIALRLIFDQHFEVDGQNDFLFLAKYGTKVLLKAYHDYRSEMFTPENLDRQDLEGKSALSILLAEAHAKPDRTWYREMARFLVENGATPTIDAKLLKTLSPYLKAALKKSTDVVGLYQTHDNYHFFEQELAKPLADLTHRERKALLHEIFVAQSNPSLATETFRALQPLSDELLNEPFHNGDYLAHLALKTDVGFHFNDPNLKAGVLNGEGQSLLHYVCRFGLGSRLKRILELSAFADDATLTLTSKEGKTPLEYVVERALNLQNGDTITLMTSMIRRLLSRKGDLTIPASLREKVEKSSVAKEVLEALAISS